MRGINVGGKHMLPMADLRLIFEKAGGNSVRTYIQSGNVVFAATTSAAAEIVADVERMIEKRFGFAPPIVLREAAALNRIVESHPFAKGESNHKVLHVGFLRSRPTAAQVVALDPERSPGDRFEVRDREIYLHTPNGAADSKFTNAYFDSTLKTICTFRNWRTVLTLAEMAAAKPG